MPHDHHTPTAEVQAARLRSLVAGSADLMAGLRAARALGLPAWCIGAGVLRNLVFDHLHGHTGATPPADVDLAYFDPHDLRPARDAALQSQLRARCPGLPWEVTNQAGVHLWFQAHFGHAVAPLTSLHEAVATWPETATAVGVWLDAHDHLHVIAPFGLDDLFAGRIRRNPAPVSVETYRQRCKSKRYAERWPGVVVEGA